jgi:hypothetical protein
LLKGDKPIKMDWENRWLKGDEYAHIICHMEDYCHTFNLQKFNPKTHPLCIYTEPESKFSIITWQQKIILSLDGMIYFVKGNSIGSDFGFPRLEFKKLYKW